MQIEQPLYEVEILRLLVKTRSYYEKYYDVVAPYITSRDYKLLYGAVDHYYKTCRDHNFIAEDDLVLFIKANYPQLRNLEIMEMLIECIYAPQISSDTIKSLVHKLLEEDLYKQLATMCSDAVVTREFNKLDDIERKIERYKMLIKDSEDSPFAAFDFDAFVTELATESGWNWRLKCLNNDIGPLQPETLGHVFARPESGKTTFLASEVTHIASQLKEGETILWINNEQAISKVWQRCISAITRAPFTLAETQPETVRNYLLKRNFYAINFVDAAYLFFEDVQALAKKHSPKVIVIDQGDKLAFHGDKNFEGHARLKELYRKYRELAKDTKSAIITVGQASAEAEGKKWLTMDMMDNSKVGKPGEMDWIVGIGISHREEEAGLRYLHIAKNKLKGKHGKHTVLFDGEKARYLDMV